jgi:hypothetical protein
VEAAKDREGYQKMLSSLISHPWLEEDKYVFTSNSQVDPRLK